MNITKALIAEKLVNYLDNRITLSELIDWAEAAIQDGDFIETDGDHTLRDVVARIGLADVKAFGLEWEDHKELLTKLGYKAKVVVQPQA